MRHSLRTRAIAVLVALFAGSMFVQRAGADGVGDQQQQVKADLAQIDRLDQRVSQLNDEYLGYMNDKATIDADIAASQHQIDGQQAELATMQGHLADLAVEKLMGSTGSDALGPLFSDPSQLNAGLQRDELARVVVDAGAASTDDYESLLRQLTQEQQVLAAKQKRADGLAKQAADASVRTAQASQDYQAELTKDQAKLGDLLAQEQQRQIDAAAKQHAADVAAAQARAAAASASAANSKTNSAAPATTLPPAPATTTAPKATPTPTTAPKPSGGKTTGATPTTTATTVPHTNAPTTTPTPAPTTSTPTTSGGDSGGTSPADPAPPPVSSRAAVAVAAARSQLGVPYIAFMSTAGVGFDCSGLTSYAWRVAGVSIPHQSALQYATTPHVPVTDVQPGDLIYLFHPISHVEMYIGNGQAISAPAPGKFVMIVNVNWSLVVGASRPG